VCPLEKHPLTCADWPVKSSAAARAAVFAAPPTPAARSASIDAKPACDISRGTGDAAVTWRCGPCEPGRACDYLPAVAVSVLGRDPAIEPTASGGGGMPAPGARRACPGASLAVSAARAVTATARDIQRSPDHMDDRTATLSLHRYRHQQAMEQAPLLWVECRRWAAITWYAARVVGSSRAPCCSCLDPAVLPTRQPQVQRHQQDRGAMGHLSRDHRSHAYGEPDEQLYPTPHDVPAVCTDQNRRGFSAAGSSPRGLQLLSPRWSDHSQCGAISLGPPHLAVSVRCQRGQPHGISLSGGAPRSEVASGFLRKPHRRLHACHLRGAT